MEMKRPEMVIFDYGHTLVYEQDFGPLAGDIALQPHIIKNKNSLTAQQIHEQSAELSKPLAAAKKQGFEIKQTQFMRLIYETLEIELDVTYAEAEEIFWDAAWPGEPMPGAAQMLRKLHELGIRTAVISNLSFSGENLTRRINRLLPDNRFEFITATSEYGYRKPSPFIFQLALKKAGLEPDKVWYCGDRPDMDVDGAGAVGMFPVWLEYDAHSNPFGEKTGYIPKYEHLHVCSWEEFLRIVESI